MERPVMEDGLLWMTSLRSRCPRFSEPPVPVSHHTKCGVSCAVLCQPNILAFHHQAMHCKTCVTDSDVEKYWCGYMEIGLVSAQHGNALVGTRTVVLVFECALRG